jgi:hypothetical protein
VRRFRVRFTKGAALLTLLFILFAVLLAAGVVALPDLPELRLE